MSFKVINGKLHFIEDYSSASLKNKNLQKHDNDKNFNSILKDKINNKTTNINNKLNNEITNKANDEISNKANNNINYELGSKVNNSINHEINNKANKNIDNQSIAEINRFIENKTPINLEKESFIISKHALERLQTRNIKLTEEDMNSINKAINKAEGKGSKECLILCKDAALITSIKNRTIITAMTKEESKNSVFTNIDSAVII